MKLKDIFPKWMLRERSYGEVEVGGSAFARLTEDEENGYLVLDTSGPWLGMFISSSGAYDYSERYTEIDHGFVQIGSAFPNLTALAIGVWDGGDHLVIKANGDMHFRGDASLDTTFRRADAGVMEILEDGGGIRLHSPDGLSTKTLQLNNDGVTLDLV